MALTDGIKNKLNAIAGVIRLKTNKPEKLTLEQMVSEIEGLSGGEAPENDVIFYDYDGKRLYSFSWDDFQLLEEMPPLPAHEGLICEGWNWTLEEAKQANGWCHVGALYITDNGATRLYIDVVSEYDKEMQIWWSKGLDAEAKILWGDGTETIVGDEGAYSHTYDNIGKYCIEIFGGRHINAISETKVTICGAMDNYVRRCLIKIYRAELGNNVNDLYSAGCFNNSVIKTVTISKNTRMSNATFSYCSYLKHINFPRTIVDNFNCLMSNVNIIFPPTIYSYYESFSTIRNKKIQALNWLLASTRQFPNSYIIEVEGLNKTATGMFSSNTCLVRVIFSPISTIASQSFYGCISLKILDFTKCTAVPTLVNIDAFGNTNDTFEILVPNSLYDQWISTANWAEYAEKIKGV